MIIHFARFCVFTVLSVAIIHLGILVNAHYPTALPEYLACVSGGILTYLFKAFEG